MRGESSDQERRPLPACSGFTTNSLGHILEAESDRPLKWANNSGVIVVRLPGDDGRLHKRSVKTLLCETFGIKTTAKALGAHPPPWQSDFVFRERKRRRVWIGRKELRYPVLLSPGVKAKFEAAPRLATAAGCHEWVRDAVGGDGYRLFLFTEEGINYSVMPHRLALYYATGRVPEGLNALHRCDNRLCCNPEHLYWGTAKDNARDAQDRKRLVGARAGRKVLVEIGARIPERIAAGERIADIARELGVTRQTVRYWARCRRVTLKLARPCEGGLVEDTGIGKGGVYAPDPTSMDAEHAA